MRLIRILLTLLIILAILLLAKAAHADGGYTPDQIRVISKIFQACQRYNVNCTIPLAIARRETQFGANRQGDWSSYKGRYQSAGIYQ